MVNYRLITTNVITGDKKILLQEKSLSKLDEFIYKNFSTLDSVASYFDISPDNEFNITYTYKNKSKFLDLILRVGKYNFLDIIQCVNDNKIYKDSSLFVHIFEDVLKNYPHDKLLFLLQNNYISKRTYDFIITYRNYDFSNNDDINDKFELYTQIKSELRRYITFRKLYSGIQQLDTDLKSKNVPKVVANTEDILLNKLYNEGDLDSVYSTYDLDDIHMLDGIETLNIDGIKKK